MLLKIFRKNSDSPWPLIARMEHDIAEMDELIGAQLELARAQEGEASEKTNIATLLTDIVDAAKAQAPGRLQLRTNRQLCVADVAPVVTLRRCIGNLLNNALRYGGNGPIQVICRRMRGRLYIGVRDRGPGMPRELAETVFRPFYRLESSRSRVTGGSGLGLAITRQLCQNQGWRVAMKSRLTGGTSVWLQITS
ncbi:MAG: sensor histidine kinase [Gammaproteobacteria bacterium]